MISIYKVLQLWQYVYIDWEYLLLLFVNINQESVQIII